LDLPLQKTQNVIGPQLSQAIKDVIARAIPTDSIEILQTRMLTGGDINEALLVKTNVGAFFVKWNSAAKFQGLFEAEADGLRALAKTNALHVPHVIGCGSDGVHVFLVLEFVETMRKRPDFWEVFGKGLAEMHKTTAPQFGWEHNNFIGSLPQQNNWETDFEKFYVENRLQPLVKRAADKQRIHSDDVAAIEALYTQINQRIPATTSSLVHGDLWGGNYLVNHLGHPCVIDPAVHFGHREADLAMMRLFGGFANDVFHHYNLAFPLEKGWAERLPFFNLYPLLVHVILFGGSYLQQLREQLKKLV